MEKQSNNSAIGIFGDVRFGLRSLSRSPIFSVFAILTLALGIGATTTVFTLVNTILLHPFPVHDPSHLVAVYATDLKSQKQSGSLLPTSYPSLKDYQNRSTAFSGFAGQSSPLVLTLEENSASERFSASWSPRDTSRLWASRPRKVAFSRPKKSAHPAVLPSPS